MATACTHLDQVQDVTPSAQGCEDCLRSGDRWVHLRICMTCGHVGCCDSSPNKHATAHWDTTQHPLVRSFEPGEDWWWCYADQTDDVAADLTTIDLSFGARAELEDAGHEPGARRAPRPDVAAVGMIVLDTDVLIAHLRGNRTAGRSWRRSTLATSRCSPTYAHRSCCPDRR